MTSPIVGGGSVMSTGSSYGGPGGYRMDDGWEGSVGRCHVGHAPDLSSTAGAIPRRPIGPQIAMGMNGGGVMMGGSPMATTRPHHSITLECHLPLLMNMLIFHLQVHLSTDHRVKESNMGNMGGGYQYRMIDLVMNAITSPEGEGG